MLNNKNVPPVKIGDRIIICGWSNYDTRIKSVTYIQKECRWLIEVDWGVHGHSKVYDHDEGKIWLRYTNFN